jgi:GAF domain-containing protein
MNKRFSLSSLLEATGGYYIIIVIAAAQFLALPSLALGFLLMSWNSELPWESLKQGARVGIPLVVAVNVLLLIIGWFMTSSSRKALNAIYAGKTSIDPVDQLAVWREITSLPWRYSGFLGIAAAVLNLIPIPVYMFTSGLTDLDQTIFLIMSLWTTISITTLFVNLVLGRALLPAQIALTPSDSETQRKGMSGTPILFKILSAFLTLIVAAILSLGSIGYHQITKAIIVGANLEQVLRTFQLQSIAISVIILAMGFGFTYFLAVSISDPAKMLIEVSKKTEQGDFSKRAEIVASDEVGKMIVFFNQMISGIEGLNKTLEQQVAERTAQLSAVNEVGQSISTILDPDLLISRVVGLITDRFGHYYAAIFLLDSTGKWAELKSATGEAGRVLRESHHRLAVDGKSMVGTAISQKQARIALDVGQEPVRFNNPLLPYTRSEIALPLIVGDRVLGALDVQSTREAAFGQEDIQTLQNMANQVAVALENARLFQETNQRIQELQAAQRQYVREAWSSFAAGGPLEYKVGDEAPLETETTINVPIVLRDEVIGQINLTGEQEWSPEEQAWVEAVSTQAAVALENARLMEESRKQASIEHTVAEITTRVWSVSSIDGILQTAVKEIGRALNLSEATIELSVEDQGEANRE